MSNIAVLLANQPSATDEIDIIIQRGWSGALSHHLRDSVRRILGNFANDAAWIACCKDAFRNVTRHYASSANHGP
jgi:hypothetical protein